MKYKGKEVIESCLLCEYNHKDHSQCEHCDSENNNFKLSKEGKELYKSIFEQYTEEETKIYITQLEDENIRIKMSNMSLRNNNKGLLQGLNKIQKELLKYKEKYGKLEQDIQE